MKKFVVVMCMLAVTFFICSNAESAGAGIGQGSSELGVFGSLSHQTMNIKEEGDTDKITTNVLMGVVNYGYFLTDKVQLGGTVLYMGTNSKDGGEDSLHIWGLDLVGKYHFYSKGQSVVPYMGIQAGILNIGFKGDEYDDSSTSFSYGAMGGLKYFITENTSFNTELNYRRYKMDFEDSKATINNLSLLIGFSVYFGK